MEKLLVKYNDRCFVVKKYEGINCLLTGFNVATSGLCLDIDEYLGMVLFAIKNNFVSKFEDKQEYIFRKRIHKSGAFELYADIINEDGLLVRKNAYVFHISCCEKLNATYENEEFSVKFLIKALIFSGANIKRAIECAQKMTVIQPIIVENPIEIPNEIEEFISKNEEASEEVIGE